MSEALFQIGVKALIRDHEGRILVEGKNRGAGVVTYDFPGGRIDQGESLEQGLRRELREEIGLDYEGPLRLITTTITKIQKPVGGWRVGIAIVVYAIEYDENHEIVLGEEEEEFMWVTPQEAADHIAFKYDTVFCNLIANL